MINIAFPSDSVQESFAKHAPDRYEMFISELEKILEKDITEEEKILGVEDLLLAAEEGKRMQTQQLCSVNPFLKKYNAKVLHHSAKYQ